MGMHWHPNSPGRHASSALGHAPSHVGTSASPQPVGSGTVVVVVELVVVEVVLVEDVVVVKIVELVVLVDGSQGQLGKNGGGLPIATFRQTSASVEVTGAALFSSQMHSGLHASRPSATFKMKRQSVEAGEEPFVIGCPQSPRALHAVVGVPAVYTRSASAAAAPASEC
jgi:hypothetical protein